MPRSPVPSDPGEQYSQNAGQNGSQGAMRSARVHGGPALDELRLLGVDLERLIDFSSSTNPYGPHPSVVRALSAAVIDRYPDPTSLAAREALSRLTGAPAAQIALGNGAADLLWTLARCLLTRGERALIAEPTFSEFRAAASAQGADICEHRSSVESAFAIDLAAIFAAARALEARVLYLCSPNTPTGSAVDALEIARFAAARPELFVVLDQSFLSSSERFEDAAVEMPANVARVRSLTKDHAIPGVRLGYAIASHEVIASIEANRAAWTTSAFAQAATLACVAADDFVRQSRIRLLDDRRALAAALSDLGIETLPSRTTFLLARVPNVSALRVRLLERHAILVRDCASFGLPGFMRLAAKPEPARSRLLAALAAERAMFSAERAGESAAAAAESPC